MVRNSQGSHKSFWTVWHVYVNLFYQYTEFIGHLIKLQVLSKTVASVMKAHSGPECRETSNFLHLMNRFFDCLNTRSIDEANRKRNPDLSPYRTVEDERFTVSTFKIQK